MNLIILGPQGSGKGTQAEMLVSPGHFQYMEMGKIMRSIAESDNKYAGIVKEFMTKGELVPDEYVRLIAWDFINKHDKNGNFLFDGYPRSLPQYEHLKDMFMKFGKKIDRVIDINISPEETVRRLSARRTCEKCGNIYNLITNPPPSDGKCECGGTLTHREDDKPEAIKIRLEDYWQKTVPVLEKAEADGILLKIDGERPIEEIHKEIIAGLNLQHG